MLKDQAVIPTGHEQHNLNIRSAISTDDVDIGVVKTMCLWQVVAGTEWYAGWLVPQQLHTGGSRRRRHITHIRHG